MISGSVAPENMLEMQILMSFTRPTEPEALGVGLSILHLTSPSDNSDASYRQYLVSAKPLVRKK